MALCYDGKVVNIFYGSFIVYISNMTEENYGRRLNPPVYLKILGKVFMVFSIFLFFGLIFLGKRFHIHGTEVNLKDPLFVLEKSLAVFIIGLLLVGKNGSLFKRFQYFGSIKGTVALTIGTAFFFVFFTLLRYFFFCTNAYDLALFENALFHISHMGDFHMNVNQKLHIFANHLSPLFIPYAFIYRFSGILGVLIIHKALLSLVVPVAFLLSRTFVENRSKVGFSVLLAVIAPVYLKLGVQDFYIESLVFPIGLATVYFYKKGKWLLFAISCLLLLSVREDAGIVLFMIFLYIAIRERNIIWFFLSIVPFSAVFVLIKLQGTLGTFSAERIQVRYGVTSIFHTKEVLSLLLRAIHPLRVFSFVVATLAFGLLPWFSILPVCLSYFVALPNLLSGYWRQEFLGGYYPVFFYPILYVAVLEGLRKLEGERLRVHVLLALSFALLMGPRNLNHRIDLDYLRACNEALSLIPKEVEVSATFRLASHLGGRPFLYVLMKDPSQERDLPHTPYVLIEETDIFYENYWRKAVGMLNEWGYREIYSKAGVRVFKLQGKLKEGTGKL